MKVLVFPKDLNPYQELLYGQMRAKHKNIQIDYLTGPTNHQTINLVLFPILLIIYRLRGYKVFHIHWTYFFKIPKFDFAIFKIIMQYYCIIAMYFIKILGYKLIWTVHETIPHDALTDKDVARSKKVSRQLSRVADAKIIHSKLVINEMKEANLDIRNTFIIPHGNYIGVYPDSITPTRARKKLGISTNEVVILFFGLIRQYKGVKELIQAYSKLESKHIRLMIVGKCIDPLLYKTILDARKLIKFDFYEGHVLDEDVSLYFKACSIVCLPFKKITTSGSALLALSFGKPIVAPRIGDLIDLPNSVGYLYDPLKTNGLEYALKRAVKNKGEIVKHGKNAMKYANNLSWDKIAGDTYELYRKILSK